jgi:hypothetical protein
MLLLLTMRRMTVVVVMMMMTGDGGGGPDEEEARLDAVRLPALHGPHVRRRPHHPGLGMVMMVIMLMVMLIMVMVVQLHRGVCELRVLQRSPLPYVRSTIYYSPQPSPPPFSPT